MYKSEKGHKPARHTGWEELAGGLMTEHLFSQPSRDGSILLSAQHGSSPGSSPGPSAHRSRQTGSDRETDRQTDRQTRQTRQTDRQTELISDQSLLWFRLLTETNT